MEVRNRNSKLGQSIIKEDLGHTYLLPRSGPGDREYKEDQQD